MNAAARRLVVAAVAAPSIGAVAVVALIVTAFAAVAGTGSDPADAASGGSVCAAAGADDSGACVGAAGDASGSPGSSASGGSGASAGSSDGVTAGGWGGYSNGLIPAAALCPLTAAGQLHDPRSEDGRVDLAAVLAVTWGAKEVEAESVAFLIGAAHGMDTSDYSLPYISTWASRDEGPATVRATGTRVIATARRVLDELPTRQWGSGQPPGLQERVEQQRAEKQQALHAGRDRQPTPTVAVGVSR